MKPQGKAQPTFILGILAVTLLIASCAVHEVRDEITMDRKLPKQFSDMGDVEAPNKWWETFDDETLNQLMVQSLDQNLDLEAAWARLRQSVALAKQAGADLVPTLSFTPSLSHSHTETPARTVDVDQIRLGLSSSYEVDLWKKIASRQKAAQFDAESSAEAIQSTALTLSSQVAKVWFDIIEQKEQLELLREQVETNRTFLELNELRFGQGLATAVDVFQQRTQLANTQRQFPNAEQFLQAGQNRLNVLIGQAPQTEIWEQDVDFPPLDTLPKTGIPLELIDSRPDIRSALAAVRAADYRVGEAIANQYPTLSLNASTGLEGDQLDDVFSNWFWNVAGNVFQPIVDGERREAEVERRRALLDQRLEEYEQDVLLAIEDVENALIREKKQRELIQRLEYEIEMSAITVRESRSRFVNGLSDYLPVLTALQSLQRLERELITARRILLERRVDLYVALGGEWTQTWFEEKAPSRMHAKGDV